MKKSTLKKRRPKKREPRRLPPPDFVPDRAQTRENALRINATTEALHSARRIIECTAFVGHEQRRVNAEWLRRHPG